MRLLLVLAAVLVLLAGCGGPYASDVETPAGREHEAGATALPGRPTGPAELTTTMRVTSLPEEAVGAATGDPVNCFYVGPDDFDGGIPEVQAVDITFTWSAEAPGLGDTFSAKAYNHPDYATAATGGSPLQLRVVPGAVPVLLPLAIRVEPNGPLALAQEVNVHVAVTGFSEELVVYPIPCQS